MDNYWIELQKALVVLQGKIETIESIQKQKGETFNIFSVLQMERLEVKTAVRVFVYGALKRGFCIGRAFI